MNGQTVIATLCVAVLLAPPGFAQQAPDVTEPQMPASGGWFSNLRRPYQARRLPPPNFTDSNRLDSLVRAGSIYLSLDDAIALALENNLDVEVGRYGPRIAEADLLRAQAGGFIRGIQTDVQQGPTSTGALAGARGGGIGVGDGGRSGDGIFGGIQIQQVGTSIPNLDPVLFFNTNWIHFTQPLTSTFTTATGSNSLVQAGRGTNYGIQKGFLSGTTVGYQWNNSFLTENSPYDDFNPWVNASMTLEVRQHLLSGFRPSVNSRLIRVAKNNIRVSDLVFKQQVITTLAAIVNLYWDLVSFNDNVRVKRQAVELAEKLYSDNKKQVGIGTLAPIEIVRAEAEVARTQQDLTNAETQVLEQETVLKNALSHHDVDDPLLSQARIVPTDSIRVPEHEQVIPIQDLYSMALQNRPEVEASEIGLENSRISIKGTKDALLPQLDLVADLRNNALAGQMNTLPIPPPPGSPPGTPFTTRSPSSVDPYFLGGWGRALTQLFSRNFPDYVFQVQLNIPLRNRSAQSDAIRDELLLRQQEINDRKTRKQVKVDVQNASIALRQAFAAYQTAVKSRQLTDQTLQAERKRFTMGATTFLNVIQVQRDMTAARLVEVTAQNSYIRAQVLLEQATGEILGNHKVILDEAKQGLVSRPPGAIPVLDEPNGRGNSR